MKKITPFARLLTLVAAVATTLMSYAAEYNYTPLQSIDGSTTIYVTAEFTAPNQYHFTVEGTGVIGFGASWCNINENEQFNISTASTLVTSANKASLTITSSTPPKFYTPLYVMMPAEIVFPQLDVSWGTAVAYCSTPIISIDGLTTVSISTLLTAPNQYTLVAEGPGVTGFGASWFYINGNQHFNTQTDGTLVAETDKVSLSFTSTTTPQAYTPLYVMMPGEAAFPMLDAKWTSCVTDSIAPVMGTATLTSVTHNAATIAVAATDNDTNPVTKFSVSEANSLFETKTLVARNGELTLTNLTAETTYNVIVAALDNSSNQSANSVQLAPFATTVHLTAPITAAPTPPARPAAEVVNIFSDAYATMDGLNIDPDWGQATVSELVEIQSNATIKYTNLNYQGTEFPEQNVATFNTLHIDVWTENSVALRLVPIVKNAAGDNEPEYGYTMSLVGGKWNTLDIPVNDFIKQGASMTRLYQFKIDGGTGNTLYIDNLYFYVNPESGIPTHNAVQVALYPNPATHYVTLTADEEITNISIVNLLGQTVQQTTASGHTATLNIEALTASTYLVAVKTKSGNTTIHKIVKK